MNQDLSSRVLSDIICYMKYAKHLPDEHRRETWEETVARDEAMHIKKYPNLETEIRDAFKLVYNKKVLPSMRSLQFAGKPIEISPNRQFNCSFCAVDSWEIFHEIMFLLLGGSGVGYSVQNHHVRDLPDIKGQLDKRRRFLIADTIEGWADAVKVLVKSYLFGQSKPDFDFSDIREKGTLLKTSGGKAPGPQPLKDCLHNLDKILAAKTPGAKLSTLECHDMVCYIADAVLAGGIRRASLIALFSMDDEEMLSCKHGNWWELNPQRGRANNSAVVLRHKITVEKFFELWERIKAGGTGEPGVFFTNDKDWGINPCQPGFATVLTPMGIITFDELEIGDVIWSGKRWTRVINKASTGVKPVYEYRTRSGSFIGTENHRVVCRGIKTEVKDADQIDICVGSDWQNKAIDHELNARYVIDGLVLGDGTVHKASNNLVLLNIGKKDQDLLSSEVRSFILEERKGIGPSVWEVSTSIECNELPKTFERKIPERYKQALPSQLISFLRGLYSANGSICGNRVTLKASSFNVIQGVQEMLSSIGIKSYYTVNKPHDVEFKNGTYTCRESYDLNISTDRAIFRKLIGFIQKDKSKRLDELCLRLESSSDSGQVSSDIRDRIYLGDHPVYDITVEAEEHTYWTGGVLVSNCAEISLRSNQFCNLSTVNVSNVDGQEDLEERCRAAAFIGTLQASYTDFHYIRDIWKKTTERDSLIGVSMTGIASGKLDKLDLSGAAQVVKEENKRVAFLLGIKPAARTTCVKPEGTASLVLGTSSGIHAWHAPFYRRRVRVLKNEAIYKYLLKKLPELVEDDFFKKSTQAIISLPIRAPENAIFRTEPAEDLLNRIKQINTKWIRPGHVTGENTHNVSATVSVQEHEWADVASWMWDNREFYNSLTVLPFDGGSYKQPPLEDITEEEYLRMMELVKEIDLSEALEEEDTTDLLMEAACSGGSCTLI